MADELEPQFDLMSEQLMVFADNYKEQLEFAEEEDHEVLRRDLPEFNYALMTSHLVRIDLDGRRDFRLKDIHVEILVDAVKKSFITPLKHIRLRNHRIGDSGFLRLCELLSSTNHTELLTLNLEGNNISGNSCYSLQECLTDTDEHICPLRELNLSCNPIGVVGGLAIANALPYNQKLNKLFLANCELTLKAVIGIATGLSSNRSIEVLVLDRPLLTTLEEESTDHFSRMLSVQPTLKEFSVRYSAIGDYGTKLLSQSLYLNSSLISINLECNKICVAGANALAKNLIHDQKLQELRLSANNLGDEGAKAIAEALKTNYSLRVLTLKHNGIKMAGLISLGMALDANNSLRSLTLWGNDFNHDSSRLYHELARLRFPYTGLQVDVQPYVVDGVFNVAEKALD